MPFYVCKPLPYGGLQYCLCLPPIAAVHPSGRALLPSFLRIYLDGCGPLPPNLITCLFKVSKRV